MIKTEGDYEKLVAGWLDREDIDSASGSHDALQDWAYDPDAPFIAEAEYIVFEAFKDLLAGSEVATNVPSNPDHDYFLPETVEALRVLASDFE